MNAPKLRTKLEIVTNVAVVMVALAVLISFSRYYFVSRLANSVESGLRKGAPFAKFSTLHYEGANRTLIFALSPKCHFCRESLPFYKRLVASLSGPERSTRVLAVFQENEAEAKAFLAQEQLAVDEIGQADFGEMKIRGTPTIVLIDSKGVILDFWVGKLSDADEQAILTQLR